VDPESLLFPRHAVARSADDLQYGAAMIRNGVSTAVSWRLPRAVEEPE
jgi:hypothetical protein